MEDAEYIDSRISVATQWAVYEGDYRHLKDEELSDALESPHSGRYIRLTAVSIRSAGAREGLPSEAPFILINREHAGVIVPITQVAETQPPALRVWDTLRSLQYSENQPR